MKHAAGPISWADRYHPETIQQVVGNTDIISRLQDQAAHGEFPHLLLSGPTGTGKSAAATGLAKEIHGEHWDQHTLRLNGIECRGQDVLRARATEFLRLDRHGTSPRILIIEHGDILTNDAQMLLRSLIDRYTPISRVIITTNYSSNVISGLQSRLAVYRFSPIETEHAKHRLRWIAAEENIDITDDALEAIAWFADGDLRKAINTLQLTATRDSGLLDEQTIADLVSSPPSHLVRDMLDHALDGDYDEAQSVLTELQNQGISGRDILDSARICAHERRPFDAATLTLINQIGEIEHRLNTGADESTQLSALLAGIADKNGS